jgi:hypothetical protein
MVLPANRTREKTMDEKKQKLIEDIGNQAREFDMKYTG